MPHHPSHAGSLVLNPSGSPRQVTSKFASDKAGPSQAALARDALRRVPVRLPVLAGVAGALLSCASTPHPPRRAVELPPVDSSLSAMSSNKPEVLASPAPAPGADNPWSQAALDLQSVLDGTATQPGERPEGSMPSAQRSESPVSEATPPPGVERAAPEAPGESAAPAPADPPRTPAQEIDDLARSLASALRVQASSSDNPLAPVDALRLAMLESILPGAAGEGTDLDPALLGTLAPVEARHVRAARDLARAWIASAKEGTLDEAPGALAAAAQELRPESGSLRTFSALCQRVSGYGAYVEIEGGELIAGRSLDVIIYTELDGFADRSVAPGDDALPGDLWAVDVSQELTLFHDPSEDLQAWHQPRSRIVSTSRRHRQEFYLVNQVRLPANLTVGRYRLKVTTRDETSGSVSESWASLSVVAGTGTAAAGNP